MSNTTDSPEYLARKKHFESFLTVYGRKPALEALRNPQLQCHHIHLAESNREDGIIREIKSLASARKIPISLHDRRSLSRISKNQKQDQGVAIDLTCPRHLSFDEFHRSHQQLPFKLLAVDGITNPQNLGMIIRSVAASPLSGLLLATRGNTGISPLVIKASAGTVFSCPLIRCESLADTLRQLKNHADICVLAGDSHMNLTDYKPTGSVVYVVGNETDGVSQSVQKIADYRLKLAMCNGVESLNVAVMASLLAFKDCM